MPRWAPCWSATGLPNRSPIPTSSSCTATRLPATVSCAVALANLDLFERQDFLGNVMANETYFRAALDDLSDLPIVGDVRGMGYFYGIELVKDPETKETFTSDEAQHLCGDSCRTDSPSSGCCAEPMPAASRWSSCRRRSSLVRRNSTP